MIHVIGMMKIINGKSTTINYSMEKQLAQVQDFNDLFGIKYKDSPELCSEKQMNARISYLEEEIAELKVAFANNDLVEVADALVDIQYFLAGAVLENGLQHVFVDLFDTVQEANMDKVPSTYEQALETSNDYLSKGIGTHIEELNGKFLVLRDGDNKVLKRKGWVAPKFDDILS